LTIGGELGGGCGGLAEDSKSSQTSGGLEGADWAKGGRKMFNLAKFCFAKRGETRTGKEQDDGALVHLRKPQQSNDI